MRMIHLTATNDRGDTGALSIAVDQIVSVQETHAPTPDGAGIRTADLVDYTVAESYSTVLRLINNADIASDEDAR